jgi:hypothetical protein
MLRISFAKVCLASRALLKSLSADELLSITEFLFRSAHFKNPSCRPCLKLSRNIQGPTPRAGPHTPMASKIGAIDLEGNKQVAPE